MTTSEILALTRDMIAEREDWSPHGWGTLRGNGPRCLLNALHCVVGDVCSPEFGRAYYAMARVVGGFELGVFNDTHTHREVLAMIDRAMEIEVAKEQEFEPEAVFA